MRIEFDVRRETALPRRARDDDHDACAALVESVGRDDDRGTATCLFGADRVTEVDEPDLSAIGRHLEASRSAFASKPRSAIISAQAVSSSRNAA